MLLQFAVSSPEYIQNHKTMITNIVNACINDKDRVLLSCVVFQ